MKGIRLYIARIYMKERENGISVLLAQLHFAF